ncbi:hypothetical protein HK097_010146 [Rhizophlyctis rosea]|uniref:Uncharacterized protein n=1 Tax=Rhizophlyctis rosea TaxID=64517 RepID=A0AAD5SAT1_9FUNG|nr:hypothetical protein HK097_010146 [Rhizophlyctis rosea]
MQQQSWEANTGLISQDGVYPLQWSAKQEGINPFIGLRVSFITIRSNDPPKTPPEVNMSSGLATDAGEPLSPISPISGQSAWVDLPIDGEGTGTDKTSFSFLGKAKNRKSKQTPSKIPSSTFVAKISAHAELAKLLHYRRQETTYVFWNSGKAFYWAEWDRGQKV